MQSYILYVFILSYIVFVVRIISLFFSYILCKDLYLKGIGYMEKSVSSLSVFMKGIVISFAITIILFYILGIILSCTSMPEKVINPAVIIITGISILIATSIVTINVQDKGMIRGGIIGAVYFILIYFISSLLLKNFDINVYSAIMFVVSFLCGGIGGVVGINLRK